MVIVYNYNLSRIRYCDTCRCFHYFIAMEMTSRVRNDGPHHEVLQRIASDLSDPEHILQGAVSNAHISDECADAIKFLIEVPITNPGKLRCK